MRIIFVPMLPTLYGRRYQLCKHMVSSGHEVHMIVWQMPYPITLRNLFESFKCSWRKKTYKKDGIYIHKVRRLPFFFPIINRLWFQRQLEAIYDKYSVQAVISQSFFNETEPPNNVPLFFDLNDNYSAFAEIYGSYIYRLSYKLLRVKHTVESQLKRSEAVFAVSDMLVDHAKKFNKNIYKVPNGVDLPKVTIKKSNQLLFGEHSLVYVSTFGKWSKVTEVIELVGRMKDKLPDIRLLLVGEGTEFKAARKLIKMRRLGSHIKLLGSVYDRKKMFEIISNCKVCLNISDKNEFRDSASPIKIFEYSLLGKTVVSTNLNEVTKLNLSNVITYDANKGSAQLEAAIIKAFKRTRDNSDVQKNVLENYNWDMLTSKIADIIKSRLVA